MPTPGQKHITEIVADLELAQALDDFREVAANNASALGLNQSDLGEITNAANNFSGKLGLWNAAKLAADNALATKNHQKQLSKATISKFAKIFRSKKSISDGLLAELMLPPHNPPRTKTPPTTPMNLVANATGQGLIKLQWKRNGNTSFTTFQIEYRTAPSGPWTILDTTTRVRYTYQAVPGVTIAFRVRAKRHGLTSAASAPFVVWPQDGSQEFQLEAA
jgi:hypothetical protein